MYSQPKLRMNWRVTYASARLTRQGSHSHLWVRRWWGTWEKHGDKPEARAKQVLSEVLAFWIFLASFTTTRSWIGTKQGPRDRDVWNAQDDRSTGKWAFFCEIWHHRFLDCLARLITSSQNWTMCNAAALQLTHKAIVALQTSAGVGAVPHWGFVVLFQPTRQAVEQGMYVGWRTTNRNAIIWWRWPRQVLHQIQKSL